MSKKSMIIWIFGVIILIFLYLLSSTDLLVKDAVKPIYQISIILKENNDDEIYTNFKKGVERAATEFNVDTNIINFSKASDIKQSILIEEEKKEGSNAIIIEASGQDLLNVEHRDFPFVIIGDEKYNFWYSSLNFSYKEVALDLAKNIEKEQGKIKEIYLFSYDKDSYENKEIYNTLREYFKESDITILDNKEDETRFRQSIESLVLENRTGEKPVIIATDSYSLNLVSKIISDSDVYQNKVKAIYGFTYNTYILNKIDEGIISGVEAFNDYELGYLSIKTAVDMIKKDVYSVDYKVNSRYINGSNLKEDNNIKFLYPIE